MDLKIIQKLVLSLCLIYVQLPCHAFFEKDLHVLTMKNGLSDNTIHSICKDRNGFIWLGTRDALNRYDGKQVKVFPFGARNNGLTNLKELSDGLLCFEGGGLLHAFSLKYERLVPIRTNHGQALQAIAAEPVNDSVVWVLGNDGLALMKIERPPQDDTIIFKTLRHYPEWRKQGNIPVKMSISPDKRHICVADAYGRITFSETTDMNRRKMADLGVKASIHINQLLYDADGNIWISTTSHGLIRYNTASGHTTRLTYDTDLTNRRLSHTDVFSIVCLEKGRYLATTWNGYTLISLNKHRPDEMTTQVFNNTTSPVFRDIETRMVSAYYDPQGILWIGTDGGGVIYSDLRNQFYNRFYQDRHNEICSILGDDEGYVWLTTFHRSILRSRTPFNSDTKLDFIPTGTPETMKRRTVLCSAKDHEGNLWFGNADGTLTTYCPRQKQFDVLKLTDQEGTTNRSSVWSLLADNQGIVWIGTQDGLFAFDSTSSSCRKILLKDKNGKSLPPLYIKALAETDDHNLWLGTTTGLYRYTRTSDQTDSDYESETDMKDPSIRSLFASTDGMLYIGYMNQLAVLNPSTNSIIHTFTTQDGLCNDFVGCITQDGNGNLWIGSNSGISRYEGRQKLFYNYYVSGSNRSALYWRNTLFWGNNKNLTYFDPRKTDQSLPSQRVMITGLEVNNRPVTIGQKVNGQAILPHSISYMKKVRLNHKNRNFALTFSSLTYSDEEQMYAYRLYPYQQEWIYTQGEEKISYTNLEHGNYAFEVKNLHPNNASNPITTLHINIQPHWSDTAWFHLCILMASGWLVVLIIRRIQMKHKRLEHELQLEHEVFTAKVERDKEKQLRMERERFFTEIAHELRTPLTLILAPLQELKHMEQLPPQVNRQIKTAFENSKHLHALMDQLLFIQKIEADMVRLKVSEININQLVTNISEPFRAIAESGHYHFHVELLPYEQTLWIDAVQMGTALSNLLSNAFKYTLPEGNVELTMGKTVIDGHNFCHITISDDGAGIPQEVKEHLFDPYTTGTHTPVHSTQTGIGMRIVKNIIDLHHGYIRTADRPDHGTIISLYIPEGEEHFDKENEKVTFLPGQSSIPLNQESNVEEVNPPKSLLIIEDNADIRQYIAGLFASEYSIEEAANGEAGLNLAREKRPDLIICDIMMPVKDGIECCRELKESPQTASIPVLMLTARTEDSDIIQALGIGADDYMRKPFNPEMLKIKIRSLIQRQERLKRLYAGTLMLKPQEEGKAKKSEDYFIQEVIRIIEANLSDENFNVKMLADQLHMSQPTLYRKIKQRSELAAIDMIRSVRMSKAASLILENRYSMQEIAEMVGYNDTRTLRKHFMSQFGVSPSKYSGQNIE